MAAGVLQGKVMKPRRQRKVEQAVKGCLELVNQAKLSREELVVMLDTIKAQKEELETNERKFKLLENSVSDIIWMMDLEESFTYVSPSVKKLLGYSVGELENLKLKDVLTHESYERHKEQLNERINKEKEGAVTGDFTSRLKHIRKNASPPSSR